MADKMTVQLTFSGAGDQVLTAADKVAVIDQANALWAQSVAMQE